MEPRSGGEAAIGTASDSVAIDGRPFEHDAVHDVLRALGRPRFAWSTRDCSIVAGGSAVSLSAGGSDRFARIREGAEAVFARLAPPADLPRVARPRLLGGFAFHERHQLPESGTWEGFPGGLFVLPAVQLVSTPDGAWLTTAAAGPDAEGTAADRLERWNGYLGAVLDREWPDPPGVRRTDPTPGRAGWRDQVRMALEDIDEGVLRKVVLAASLSVDLDGRLSVPAVLARLEAVYPDCTRFMVEPPGSGTFFGATPERLVSLRERAVRTTVLAGSIGRGDTEAEDAWLADDLSESAKDTREHELVLEAVQDQLGPLSSSVETGERRVRKLATVQHLETPVRATLEADRHVLEFVEALHPTPAVGGMPQDAALRTIRDREAFDRGWYAAPVGWIDADGDGAFSVAIRSGVAGGSSATLFAGNGIVADSDPDLEWGELQLKYRWMLDELA